MKLDGKLPVNLWAKLKGVESGTVRVWITRKRIKADYIDGHPYLPIDMELPNDNRYVEKPIRNRRKNKDDGRK